MITLGYRKSWLVVIDGVQMVQTTKNYLATHFVEQNVKGRWDLLLNLLLYVYNSIVIIITIISIIIITAIVIIITIIIFYFLFIKITHLVFSKSNLQYFLHKLTI